MTRLVACAAGLTLLVLAGCGGSGPAADGPTPPAVVERPAPPNTLSYHADVAPIVHVACSPCHRPGESAPFDLLTYDDVRARARQIVDVVRTGFMPPWLPEPGHGTFLGERRLTPEQIGRIAQWVDEGTVEGDPASGTPPPRFTDGWQLGTPDLIVEMPEAFTLPADGRDIYRNFVFPIDLPEARYVRAVEFRPGNARAIHHATLAVDRTGGSRFYDESDPVPGFDGMINRSAERPDGHMIGWVPGKQPYRTDDAIAWRLDPGADMVVQLHLQTTGRPESIRSRIGLFFAETEPTRVPLMLRLGPQTIDVPAGATDYAIEEHYVLPVEVEVLGIAPHAHYLGKSMRGWATSPDGRETPLLWIPQWDFNWQDEYRYAEPVRLPKGAVVSMRFTYDNSEANVANPHQPPERVVFGPNTTDEMGDLWLQVLTRDARDREILRADFVNKEIRSNVACYEKMVEVDPDDVEAVFELGVTLEMQDRHEEAIARLEHALELDPRLDPARRHLGRALHAVGRFEEAVGQFRRALETFGDRPELHYNLGQSLARLGRGPEAIAAYREALRLQPEFAPAWAVMAQALMAGGAAPEAEAAWRRAIELEPRRAESHNNLGILLARQGRLDEALALFREAVAIDPGYAQAHGNLGMALVERGAIDEGLRHLEIAARLNPGDARALQRLAVAQRRASSIAR